MTKEDEKILIEMLNERMSNFEKKLDTISEQVSKLRLALVAAVAGLLGSGAINIVEFINK